MMKSAEILLIAPDLELYNTAKGLQGSIGFDFDVEYAFLDDAVELAEKQNKTQDIKVILSRGATMNRLRDSNLKIPFITINITDLEMITLLSDARKTSDKIAVIGFIPQFTERVGLLSGVLGFTVDTYMASSSAEAKEKVKLAIANGNEVIIGAEIPYKDALANGASAILLTTPKEVIIDALLEAQKFLVALKSQIHQSEQQQAILNTIKDGIISVDTDGAIQYSNAAARSLIDINNLNIVKVFGDEILPLIERAKNSFGEIISIGEEYYVLNISPIFVDNEHIGAIISFSMLKRFQELEFKTRTKLADNGLTAKYRFEHVLTQNKEMQQIIEKCKKYALHASTILISGQSGTGKELIAQSIHNASLQKDGSFVAINCAALPENLLESELFGYVDGAFTGAKKGGKAGFFELAHGGTLFLDEIGEITPAVQSRLLRVLEEKSIMRIGDDKIININVRVIFASNKNLLQLVKENKFREDLYYRINVLNIQLPTLAQRREDILFLSDQFLKSDCQTFGKPHAKFDHSANQVLQNHAWPGNIRELRNVSERIAINLHSNIITKADVLECIDSMDFQIPISTSKIKEYEYELIHKAAVDCKGDKDAMCRQLGISKTTLWRRMKAMKELK